jgi:ATP-dependent helicase IRC3
VAELTAAFTAAGIDARYVTGNTKESERQALVEAFKAREFPVMINCQLFTEGTDIPNVSCDVPTEARGSYVLRSTAFSSPVLLDLGICSVKWQVLVI